MARKAKTHHHPPLNHLFTWAGFWLGMGLECFCSLFSTIWGGWLLYFRPLHHLAGMRVLYYYLSGGPVRPDFIYGGAMVAVGATGLLLFLFNRNHGLRVRAFLALISSFLFLTIAILIMMEDGTATGIPAYGLISFANLATYAQLLLVNKLTKNIAHQWPS